MALLHDLQDNNDNAEQREKQSQYLDFLDDEVFESIFFNLFKIHHFLPNRMIKVIMLKLLNI